jgi:hypothetical protein
LRIAKEFKDSDETYGYRRIHAQLARAGVPCGPELVRSIMRELGLQPCQPRPWRAGLTEQDGREHHIPDLLGQDFTAAAPGQKLVGDITYIGCGVLPMWEAPSGRAGSTGSAGQAASSWNSGSGGGPVAGPMAGLIGLDRTGDRGWVGGAGGPGPGGRS